MHVHLNKIKLISLIAKQGITTQRSE